MRRVVNQALLRQCAQHNAECEYDEVAEQEKKTAARIMWEWLVFVLCIYFTRCESSWSSKSILVVVFVFFRNLIFHFISFGSHILPDGYEWIHFLSSFIGGRACSSRSSREIIHPLSVNKRLIDTAIYKRRAHGVFQLSQAGRQNQTNMN